MRVNEMSAVTVILRGYSYDQVRLVCDVIKNSSIKNVEITTNSPNVFATVKRIKEEFGDRLNVGVGTVLTIEHAISSHEAGADFILSPILLDKEIIAFCNQHKIVCVAAAMSPTEIYEARRRGADVVKVFPANSLGFTYAKDVQAPLGEVDLMAVGGVNQSNVKAFLDSGYAYVGIGSGIFKKEDIQAMNEEGLHASLVRFEAVLA